ncbi:MAG TPA: endo-1,4-beta-xylanase [Ktedonobacterales bacterium]
MRSDRPRGGRPRAPRTARPLASRARGLAAILWILALLAACGTSATSRGTPSPASTPSPTATPSRPVAINPSARTVGMNAEPSMQPWRYIGPSPDSWWDPTNGQRYIDAEMALDDRLGVQAVRLEFPWWVMEPARQGTFDWSQADDIVAAAAAHHLQLTPVIVWTPRWAAPQPWSVPPASALGAFVTALVTRYHTSIHYWEMWNEPNSSNYFTGTEAQYVENVLIPGARAVHHTDPTAKVIAAGTSSPDIAWINQLYALGARGSFDIMGFHDYGYPPNDAPAIRAALASHGDAAMPIWLGEYGVQEQSTNDVLQQSLLTHVLTSGGPIAMAQWYTLRDTYRVTCCPTQIVGTAYWGLVQHDDTTLKTGFTTMQHLIQAGLPTPS